MQMVSLLKILQDWGDRGQDFSAGDIIDKHKIVVNNIVVLALLILLVYDT
jgi:hypothetical protein